MSFVKRSLLLLLLAAVSTYATTENCTDKAEPITDLQKIQGEWVLLWYVSDKTDFAMENLTNSHVELALKSDNVTISYIERNYFSHNDSCITYKGTLKPDDQIENTHKVHSLMEEKNGVEVPFNDNSTVQYYEMNDYMVMFYDGNVGKFLLVYKKEGDHEDFAKTSESHADFEKLADCLKIPRNHLYTLKQAGDSCHKKSAKAGAAAASR